MKKKHFITQQDGHSCGVIACLKMMDLYHVLNCQVLLKNMKKPMLLRKMVVDHYKYLLTLLSLDIVLIKKVKSLDDLNKKNNVLCFCNHKRQYDAQFMQTACCKKLIHKQCLSIYLKKYAMCPFCAKKVNMEDIPPQTPV